MRISIRVSSLMEECSKYPGSAENRYIRVPFELRDICELKPGSFANLRSTDGKIVTLRVGLAYNKDVATDPLSAYVSRGVFEALQLEAGKQQHEQEIEVIEGMTLGCDPEFFLIDVRNWNVIHAYNIFHKYGQLGSDGLLMEIRPLPSTDETVIVNSIWSLIKQARAKINSMKLRRITSEQIMMVAVSHYKGLTAGFHLHFGLPRRLIGGLRGGARWNVKNQIARAMDYYVGIPSILPEGHEDYIRRTAKHITYGKPGEWRQDNGITFEYRVPGGSLLRHPILTLGLLGLGAIVMEDTLSRIKICTNSFQDLNVISSSSNLKEIYPNVPGIFDLYKVICSKDLTIARAHLKTILDDLAKMVGFEKRKDSIEQMFRCIYDGTKFSPDLEENWRSFYERQQRSVDVLSA